MLNALNNGALGMSVNSQMLDVVANNLANIDTTGFKKSYLTFRETMHKQLGGQGLPVNTKGERGSLYIAGPPLPIVTELSKEQGALVETERELDLAVQGAGFFQVQLSGGKTAYTRNGSFHRDAEGYLVTQKGYRLVTDVFLGTGDENIRISKNGEVFARTADGEELMAGQLELHTFDNPSKLRALGGTLFEETSDSGTAVSAQPGQQGSGMVLQGFLEKSNVDMAEETTRMIQAQRAFQFNSRSISVAEEMWSLANNIRR